MNLRFTDTDFNGAALFQSGEPAYADLIPLGVFTSMGPLFFRAENLPARWPFGHLPGTSMGPLFFRAENRPAVGVSSGWTIWNFNGAALFQSGERSCSRLARPCCTALQWGRSFSERRTRVWGSSRMTKFGRFNGAALFQSGERPQDLLLRLASCCFNGAALFQSGEPAQRSRRGEQARFNGAALFQSGEPRHLPHRRYRRVASMGPLFFRAENYGAIGVAADLMIASMGPLFFRAENPMPDARTRPGGPRASMGPLFLRAENADTGRTRPGGPRASMGPLFFRAENAWGRVGRVRGR